MSWEDEWENAAIEESPSTGKLPEPTQHWDAEDTWDAPQESWEGQGPAQGDTWDAPQESWEGQRPTGEPRPARVPPSSGDFAEEEEEWEKAGIELEVNEDGDVWNEQNETWEAPKWEFGPTQTENRPAKEGKGKKKKTEQQEVTKVELTAEEKLKMKKEAEEKVIESDLGFAKDLFAGVGEIKSAVRVVKDKWEETLATLVPKDEKDFQELARVIAKGLEKFIDETEEEDEDEKEKKKEKIHLTLIRDTLKFLIEGMDSEDINEIVKVLMIQSHKAKGRPKPVIPKKKATIEIQKEEVKIVNNRDYDDDYDFM